MLYVSANEKAVSLNLHRYTKAAVLSADLPPKTETVVRIPLSEVGLRILV
jgi:hypothetical protein